MKIARGDKNFIPQKIQFDIVLFDKVLDVIKKIF